MWVGIPQRQKANVIVFTQFSGNLPTNSPLYLKKVKSKLYRNVKGVEFYLVELVKVLKNMGIDTFDVVPEWAKPILQFIVDH